MRLFVRPLLVAVAILAMSSCAPKTVPVPVVARPMYPDFVQPSIPSSLAGNRLAAESTDRAWHFLQAGDLRNAGREIAAALKAAPDFFPADATSAYVELAQKNANDALKRFDRVLSKQSDYAPALVGKAEALVALDRDTDAIDSYQAALAADRSLPDIARRVDVLRFRMVQRDVAAAREAARSGDAEKAIRAYRTAIERSPDTAFLYRELAAIEREKGDMTSALDDFRKAASLDPTDAASLAAIGELLEARDEVDAALKAYSDALAIGPDARVEARRNALRARAEAARLPEQYRAIEAAAQITRGDLAALIAIRLGGLLQAAPPRDVGVITDIRGHWAERWILEVARAGAIDPFDNHTFQPRTLVRRMDLAQAVTRLLAGVAVLAPAKARQWANARGQFSDITTGHLAYPAASAAVAAGVMTVGADRAFQPNRIVAGSEAIAVVDSLRALAALPAGTAGGPP